MKHSSSRHSRRRWHAPDGPRPLVVPPCSPRERGFTYLGVLFVVALLGVTAALASTTASFESQRERERELLFVGRQYAVALERYRAAHARSGQPYPATLDALLGEGKPRVVRYLRRLYADPMTDGAEWGLVRTPAGGIVGIYSLSERMPIRRQPYYGDEPFDIANARSYRDWVFGRTLPGVPMRPEASASAPASAPAPVEAVRPPEPPPEDNGAPPLQWPGGRPPSGDGNGS